MNDEKETRKKLQESAMITSKLSGEGIYEGIFEKHL